jgi:hypothetical protein
MILWPSWCSVGYWKFTISNLKKTRELSGAERWLLAQALLALPLVALGLRCWGFRRLQARLNQGAALALQSPAIKSDMDQARATARMVRTAACHNLFRPTCLPQSLVLWWLLRRQGLAGELHIGVRPEASRLEAHAWVEFQGQPLNDGADVGRRFAPFSREIIPPASP